MKKSKLLLITILFSAAQTLFAQTAPDAAELTKLLNEFLAGASRNDAAIHDRFWAEDLIYTRSAGLRVTKADVMRDVRSAPAPKPGDPKATYTAEEIRIQQYGNTAVVAFRLVATTETNGVTRVANLLNSGTLVKRDGKWQVVNWQSTRMRTPEDDIRKDVTSAHNTFFQALLAADATKLMPTLDTTFVWTHTDGHQVTGKQLLDDLAQGRLKYSKLETDKIVISTYGDTAVVRGESVRQRTAIPGANAGDTSPFTAFYTLTLLNQGSGWRVVAMHTSKAP